MTARLPAGPPESGAVLVEFVLVTILLVVLFLGIVQLALALHVRNTLVASAAEGARYGALADRTPEQGAERARQLIRTALGERFTGAVRASATDVDGVPVVEVEVRAPLPLLGPIGPDGVLVVSGHALDEKALGP
ncbi:MAG: pilus assembly protein [Sporichthyaceae bacterium]|nr:pilus assembly protein [Sporichthyaceae bacterium]